MDIPTLQGQPLRVGGITSSPATCCCRCIMPGEVVNVQLINANGDKRMLAGGQVKAACHTLSGPDNAVIWLTEGYATGLTVHRLTGETVCVALSANNPAAVASSCAATTRTHGYCWRPIMTAAAPGRPAPPRRPHSPAVSRRCRRQKATGTTSTVSRVLSPRARSSAFSQPPQPSPFDTLSDADLKAMSASEKAELLAEHYGNTPAVPPVGKSCAAIRVALGRCCRTDS